MKRLLVVFFVLMSSLNSYSSEKEELIFEISDNLEESNIREVYHDSLSNDDIFSQSVTEINVKTANDNCKIRIQFFTAPKTLEIMLDLTNEVKVYKTKLSNLFPNPFGKKYLRFDAKSAGVYVDEGINMLALPNSNHNKVFYGIKKLNELCLK